MNEEATQEEQQEEVKPNFVSLLKDLPNAPDQATIDAWKAKHGEIFVSGFSETEFFIWRSISRKEYKALQIEQQKLAVVQQSQQPDPERTINDEANYQEKLVSTCVLWPTGLEVLVRKAGTVPTLAEQIMQNSNFTTPQQASMLVMKL